MFDDPNVVLHCEKIDKMCCESQSVACSVKGKKANRFLKIICAKFLARMYNKRWV